MYDWTGDPATDEHLFRQAYMNEAQNYQLAQSRSRQGLANRGFLGGGQDYQQMMDLSTQNLNTMGGFQNQALAAQAQRKLAEQQREQELQNQMRFANYQATLGRGNKMSREQRAMMYGMSGAAAGAPISGWGALVGGAAGAAYGYFGPGG